jgi:carbonic anhydrase
VSGIDDLVRHAEQHAAGFQATLRTPRPARKVAVVACMDARLDLFGILGLNPGDAHLIRNAGGVATDDVIRSLAISQRQLGTRDVVLVHHTDCGMLTFTEDEFRRKLLEETGMSPPWAVEAFTDLDADVRSSMARIHNSPFVPYRDCVRGFVYDVDTGELREVLADAPAAQ